MDDLIAFLRARLDKEERVAQTAAASAGGAHWHGTDSGLYNEDARNHPGPFLADVSGYLDEALVDHLTHHDPARVLRKVKTDRRMLDRAVRAIAAAQGLGYWSQLEGEFHGKAEAYRDVLRDLAEGWDDHDDYQEDWRP